MEIYLRVRRAHYQDGLSGVFAGRKSGSPASDMDAKIKDLHAKIGELTVERDFLSRGLDR